MNNIENKFKQQFSKFKTLFENNSDSNSVFSEFSNFLNIYSEIQQTYLGEEIVSKTIERFNNTNLLNQYIKNFYKSVNDSYQKYESECYINHFKKNLNNYISKPEEIINKINQLKEDQIFEKNYSIGNVTNILLNEIKYSIKNSYSKIHSIIENEYDKIFSEIPRSSFEYDEEFNLTAYFEQFFEDIKNIYPKEIDIMSLSDDPFNIRLLNNNSESEFYYNFYHLTKQIQHDYAFRFCDGEDKYDICPNFIKDTLLNEDQQYNSQISKARSIITQMKSTVILSTEFLSNEKTLSNLNSSEYYEYYKNVNNFKGDAIISDIISYVNKKDSEFEKNIQPSIKSFTNKINETFTENLNKELFFQILNVNITSNIFIIDENITAIIRKDLSEIKSSIMRAFSNEKNYYKNKKYFSPSQSYYDSFHQLKDNIKNVSAKVEISLNKELIDEITKVFNSRIDDIASEIKKQIQLTLDSQGTFELFNSTLTLSNYSFGFLDENIKNLKTELRKLIEEIYKNKTDSFKKKCEEIINEKINTVIEFLEDEFEATTAELEKNADLYSADESIDITTLFNSTTTNILNNYQKFIQKLIDLFNDNNLSNKFKKSQNDSINNLDQTFTLGDFQSSLSQIATELKEVCKTSESDQKTLFKIEIQTIISKNFISSVKTFVENKGNEYLEQIFYEDFILNFMNDFYFIENVINNTHHYINLILQNKNIISKNFKNTLEGIYPYLNDGINKSIIPKIDSIVKKKLDDFNVDVKAKILNGFKDNTVDMLKSIKVKLSDKILSLIPEQFTQSFLVSLNQSMDELFESNYFGVIKKSYENNITNEIEQLSEVLNNYKEEMVKMSITIKRENSEILLIKDQLTYLNVTNNEYNNSFTYLLNDNVKESLKSFINETNNCLLDLLGDYLKNIININEDLGIRLEKYQNETTSYNDAENKNFRDKISKKTNETERLLEMNNIGKNINQILNSIKNFSDFQNSLEKNITKRNLINNKRSLNEYNIEIIEDVIQDFQKSINDFAEKLLSSNELLSIFNKRIQFTYSLINNIEYISDYDIKFQNLLNNYATKEMIKSYSNTLITIGLEQGRDFLTKSNIYIEKCLSNLNKVYLESLYSPIKYSIKKAVDEILDKNFKLILKKVEKIPNNEIDNKFDQLMQTDANMHNEICLFGVCIQTSINISQIYYSYGLYYNTTDDKYINVEVFLKSNIKGDIKQNICNLFFEVTNGTFANSSMHIIPQYNLVDQKTYLKTLANQYEGQYTISIDNNIQSFIQEYNLVEVKNKSIEKVF